MLTGTSFHKCRSGTRKKANKMQKQSKLRCFCIFICFCCAFFSAFFSTKQIFDGWSCMTATAQHKPKSSFKGSISFLAASNSAVSLRTLSTIPESTTESENTESEHPNWTLNKYEEASAVLPKEGKKQQCFGYVRLESHGLILQPFLEHMLWNLWKKRPLKQSWGQSGYIYI